MKSSKKQVKALETQMPRSTLLPGHALSLLCQRGRLCAQQARALEAEGNLSAGIATRHYTNEI